VRKSTEWRLLLLLAGSLSIVALLLLLDARRSQSHVVAVRDEKTKSKVVMVTDATGVRVAAGDYKRIASCSSIADAVLPELISTDRLIAVSSWYAEHNANAARLTGKSKLSGLQELETVISLKPDLIIVSNYAGDTSPLLRLREGGQKVFDLGPMLGQVTLERNLRELAQLLNMPEMGERMARQFTRRMRQVAAHVPNDVRKRGIYLNLYDTQLHGGTLGSSYYDVLTAAGLTDVADRGKRFDTQGQEAWPRHRLEDVILMAPDVIVTVHGKGKLLCALPGFEVLPACRALGGIVELDEGLLNDPGPGMLGAAEAICDQVYPREPARR
jgi:iron complex transport system substrate-binding protein